MQLNLRNNQKYQKIILKMNVNDTTIEIAYTS